MESPTLPAATSPSERNQRYVTVARKLVLAGIIVLAFLGAFWEAISSHQPDFAETAGLWLGIAFVWTLSSAYSTWRKIPAFDKTDPQLKGGRVISTIALGFLLAVILGAVLGSVVPLRQRLARSRRIEQVLKQAKLDVPLNTQTRLNFGAIMSREVSNFTDFQKQCADLQTTLIQNDVLVSKKKAILEQLGQELTEPDALSAVELFKQMGDEDAKAASTLRTMTSCSDTLANSAVSKQKKFRQLCIEPAQSQLLVSAEKEKALLKQAQVRGMKLPPDIVEALK